jgi:Phytanoyl-CoA dioxygenase (PhyH)
LAENGPLTRPKIKLSDGFAIDDSMSLPHLPQLLDESEKIIAERGGVRNSEKGRYRSHFQDLWMPMEDSQKYPVFLDFATCSDVLATVIDSIKTIPVLTNNVPSGMLHDSQLYHIDYYSLPNVYVLILLRDTTSENGPWTFLPRSVTKRVTKKLGYWTKKHGYRVSDDQVYSVAKREEAIEFTGKRGTVLFIESSGCMHFGSRNCFKPRFQLMLGYSGICRTDFHETFAIGKIILSAAKTHVCAKWC